MPWRVARVQMRGNTMELYRPILWETAMLKENLFQKIIDKQIPASIVYEDDRCLAFRDTNPQAPTHVLIIPRKVIPTHDDLTEADRELAGHLHIVAVKVARELGLADGYRLVRN